VAASHNNLASALRTAGDPKSALRHYRRAIEIYDEAVGPHHVSVAHPLTGAGQVLLELGRPTEAIEVLERALALREANDVGDIDLGEARFTLARALGGVRRADPRARALAEAALHDFQNAGPAAAAQRDGVAQWLAATPASG
jgi:tetratricopeptide (TPR) repeat protein